MLSERAVVDAWRSRFVSGLGGTAAQMCAEDE